MVIEVLSDLQAKYRMVCQLIRANSINEAQQCLKQMKRTIQTQLEESPEDHRWTMRLSLICMHLGIVALVAEDIMQAEDELRQTIQLVKGNETEPDCILITLNTLIHLGMVWLRRGNPEKNRDLLVRAQKYYILFKGSNCIPFAYDTIFKDFEEETQCKTILEMLYTYTLLNLSDVYFMLNEKLTGSVYCHLMLKHQLKFHDYHPIDWVINVAMLADHFISMKVFEIARHHLMAACLMLTSYKDNHPQYELTEESKRTTADLCRLWGKYGNALLVSSMNSEHTFLKGIDGNQIEPHSCISDHDVSNLFFPLELLNRCENPITDQYLRTYDEAKPVFVKTMKWYYESIDYYSFYTHTPEHVDIILDISRLFKNITMFIEDTNEQCTFHKCRAGLLEKVVNDILPHAHLKSYQKVWLELGETYLNILQYNNDFVRISHNNQPSASVSAMNALIRKTVSCFQKFLRSIDEFTSDDVTRIPARLEKSVISACSWIALINTKLYSTDITQQIESKQLSMHYYQRIADYCQKYKSAWKHVPDIANIWKIIEMLQAQVEDLAHEM